MKATTFVGGSVWLIAVVVALIDLRESRRARRDVLDDK
jgi:hypothetical protein